MAELELTNLPQLSLAVIEDFDAEVTPELVVNLCDMLPGCNIIAHAGPSHENLAGLEARDIDMAVAADIESPADWIEQHPLLRDPYILVTAKGLLVDDQDPVAQLMAAPMVRFAATQLMGRHIDTHLRRLRLAPPRRCEFESNHAVMAAVARLQGWTIATPSGYLRAPRFHAALEARPLPVKSFARVLSLHARQGVLGALPGRAAGMLRSLLNKHCVEPALREMPWLTGRFRVLGEEPSPAGRFKVVES